MTRHIFKVPPIGTGQSPDAQLRKAFEHYDEAILAQNKSKIEDARNRLVELLFELFEKKK
jgi:hypothetical protein